MAHFEISKYGTFRWVDNNLVKSYNTIPLDSQVDDLSYAQPIQCGGGGYQSDIGQIQLTSDFVPTGGLYDYATNAFIKIINFIPLNPPILGFTFIGYNAQIDFSDIDPGLYYCKINYTDGTFVVHDWRTSPLDIEIFHDGTQLMQATNFSNDKGFVFINADLTTVVISFRVGSLIAEPLAKTDAQDYEDQYNDLTQETSIPFVTYSQLLYGPSTYLLPFWVIEKINLLYSLDQVLWDGQPFTKISNAEFKPTRSPYRQGALWEVDVQPNFNYPSEQFITGTPPSAEFIVVTKAKKYPHRSADFAIIGIFTADMNFTRIAVVNNTVAAFTMKIGTFEGDNSLGQIVFPDDDTDSIDIGHLFRVPTTVWISGIAGTDLDITIVWEDYTNTPVIPPVTTSKFEKNTLYYFEEIVPGSFTVEFNVATGLGNVGTAHEGCVLAGTNGTPARAGRLIRVWDSAEVFPANTRGTLIGNNTPILTIGNLPTHNFNTVNGDRHTSGGSDLGPGQVTIYELDAPSFTRSYLLQGSTTLPDRGVTNSLGNNDPLDVTNKAVILPAFYYIG